MQRGRAVKDLMYFERKRESTGERREEAERRRGVSEMRERCERKRKRD